MTKIFLHKLRAFFFCFLPGHFNQAGVLSLPSATELEWTFEELFMGRILITLLQICKYFENKFITIY